MTTRVETLRNQLELLSLDTRGNKTTLRERLRKHLKKNPESAALLKAAANEDNNNIQAQGDDDDDATAAAVTADGQRGKVTDLEAVANKEYKEEREEQQVEQQEQRLTGKARRRQLRLQGPAQVHAQAQVIRESDETKNKIVTDAERDNHVQKEIKKALHGNSRYDYYLCFDVEATCERDFSFEFPNEVIEFPVVLLDGSTLEIVDEFHSYVRPTHRPVLSDFCVQLTGITQETVDAAPTFTEVLDMFEDWLTKHGIILGAGAYYSGHGKNQPKIKKSKNRGGSGSTHNALHHSIPAAAANDFYYGASFCFVTDGPFDIRDFISKQCIHSHIPRPSYFAQSYIDIRTMFRDYFDLVQWCNLEAMLGFLGESFTGRQHSGICDARMVALIAKSLAEGFPKRDGGDGDGVSNEDGKDSHPIFAEEKQGLVIQKWDQAKLKRLKEGCVLKANRGTNQAYIKMLSFKRVEKIEAGIAAAAAAEAEGAKESSSSSAAASTSPKRTKESAASPSASRPLEVEIKPNNALPSLELSSLSTPSSPLSPPLPLAAPQVSFVADSKFAILMSDAASIE
ncbi:hypothetical protein BGZ98_010399 [Dissophora globulifera]|nr:hypothetical protein BGZ98_010399 [Dissophora globulifera]